MLCPLPAGVWHGAGISNQRIGTVPFAGQFISQRNNFESVQGRIGIPGDRLWTPCTVRDASTAWSSFLAHQAPNRYRYIDNPSATPQSTTW